MKVEALLYKYFHNNEQGLRIVLEHSRLVATKALTVARSLSLPTEEISFIEEAALLHDIGVCRVSAPDIGCHGELPYICHGVMGADILNHEGLPRHALVCERHIGVGLTIEDIRRQGLPLPERPMVPESREERIVAFADLFFSKRPDSPTHERTVPEVRAALQRFGGEKVAIFDTWLAEFTATHFSL
ncbi:MAG TPA: HD domain-containing protein [Geobacterales bacterium]|nr:HD domain-containing protein [Geobacterales bacterium]